MIMHAAHNEDVLISSAHDGALAEADSADNAAREQQLEAQLAEAAATANGAVASAESAQGRVGLRCVMLPSQQLGHVTVNIVPSVSEGMG